MYCANNPVIFVDPDGREIWIGQGNDRFRYQHGMSYNGDDKFISKVFFYLNAINDYGGSKMLNKLISSSNEFNIINEKPTNKSGETIDGVLVFAEFPTGGGNVYANLFMDVSMTDYQNIEGLSHELFHGVQHEEGQGGASIFNEVEAYVYSDIVALDWVYNTIVYGTANSANGLGRPNVSGKVYEKEFSILKEGFATGSFINAVVNFKAGAEKNVSGRYNNYPLQRENQKKSILKKYYPK